MSDYPINVRFPMHWGEMDALGHANNTRYFAWFETARIALFEEVGIIADQPSSVGPILATTTCDFLRPISYPADLVASARVSKVGRTSFVMEYAIRRAEDPDKVCAKGSGVVVLIDYATGEKRPVPDDLRDTIDRLHAP